MTAYRIRIITLSACAIVAALPVITFVVLRIFGLACIYSIPTNSMAPAIAKGDHIFTEGITYLSRKPARGEIVVASRADDEDPSRPDIMYAKRIIGLPGETLRFSNGKLYVNDKQTPVTDSAGEINFTETLERSSLADGNSVTIPQGHYFVIGDDLAHSADSRLWGPIPAESIKGHVVLCWWPPARIGSPK